MGSYTITHRHVRTKNNPNTFKKRPKMVQNCRQNNPKSRFGGGLGGSWSLSGRLGRVLGLAGRVLGRLGHVLGCLGRHPGRVLGRPGGVLWGFEASLGASSDVLGHLGGVLGLIFIAKGT